MLTLQQKFFEEKYLNLFGQQTTSQSTEKKSQLMQLFLRTNAQIVEEWQSHLQRQYILKTSMSHDLTRFTEQLKEFRLWRVSHQGSDSNFQVSTQLVNELFFTFGEYEVQGDWKKMLTH
jgi:hypothetical protein